MAAERTEGYWISPEGDIAKVREHFEAVSLAPEAFGFTAQQAAGWTRADRDRILREAILRGWIRVREHRNSTTFEMREMTADSGLAIRTFLETTGAWPQEAVEIHEIATKRAWRETAGYFLEERHLALLGQADGEIVENGVSSALSAVLNDPGILREQGFVPRGVPRVYPMGEHGLGTVVRSERTAALREGGLAAAFVMGLSSGFGFPETFDPDRVRDLAMKRFPQGGTLVVQLGWFEGTREDSIRLTIEQAGTGMDEEAFRKEIEALVRAFVKKFRQRSIWLDYYRDGARLEALTFDWKA